MTSAVRAVRIDCTSDRGWEALAAVRANALLAGKSFVVTVGGESPITERQFGALHVWCQQVADVLNAAGFDQRIVLKPEVAIDWTKESVKQSLYKPLLKAMSGKSSTTEQNTVEPSAVAETIARHLGQKFGVVLPEWPKR